MPDESQGSIHWLQDGRTRIELENGSPPIILKRPTLGQLKRARFSLAEIQTEYREGWQKIEAIEDADERLATLEKLGVDLDQWICGWWRSIIEGDGERPGMAASGALPADSDDWPADLVIGEKVCIRTIDHWMHRPLGLGREMDLPYAP